MGGLLFGIETTSTFYLVSNYWKSFLAAIAGAVAINLFLIWSYGLSSDPLLIIQMTNIPEQQYVKWELCVFGLMGIMFGYLAHFYLYINQKMHVLMHPYNEKYPIVTAITVAIITSMLVYFSGAYTANGVGVVSLLSELFNAGELVFV